ncbi:MAG: hypothetical protein D3923_08695 [Candidatus Electrothrix sp. AR3]|nr:hypothetical protein [Candidatus Electrothrix sp. AR3]
MEINLTAQVEKFLKWLTLWGMIVMILATMCGIEQQHCSDPNATKQSETLLAKYFVAQNAFACRVKEKFGIPSILVDNLVASSIMICFFLAPLWLLMAYRVRKLDETDKIGSWMSLFKSQMLFWVITLLIIQMIDIKSLFPKLGGVFLITYYSYFVFTLCSC